VVLCGTAAQVAQDIAKVRQICCVGSSQWICHNQQECQDVILETRPNIILK
jgi:hypothetical protein